MFINYIWDVSLFDITRKFKKERKSQNVCFEFYEELRVTGGQNV